MSTTSQAISARIAEHLASSVGQHRFNMWFDRTARLEYDDQSQQLDVTVPNRVVADWIDRKFRQELSVAAREAVGEDVELCVRIAPDNFGQTRVMADAGDVRRTAPRTEHTASQTEARPAARSTGARSTAARSTAARKTSPARANGKHVIRHDLDEFVVGPNNELAYNAAHQLIDSEHAGVNPLFIHGGVGLGKTHLLQGICRKFKQMEPDARVHYTTGEQFTNEFLTSMRTGKLDQFRKRIRRLDLLAIDDVHFLAGKEKSQQEFLHSFDEIDLGGARVVMASDNHPKLIKQFSAALVSRCVRGLVAEITPPDNATRIRIVKALAERRGLSLVEAVVAVLASRCRGSVREIEGTLAKLHALATLTDGAAAPDRRNYDAANGRSKPIGLTLVNRLFESQSHQPRRPVDIDHIVDVVCSQLGVSRQCVLGRDRIKPIVLARSLIIFLARKLTKLSYPEIKDALKRNSHSTVIAADRRISEQLKDDAPLVLPGELETMPLSALIDRLREAIVRG